MTLPLPTELAARSGFLTSPFLMWRLRTASFLILPEPMVAAAYALPPATAMKNAIAAMTS